MIRSLSLFALVFLLGCPATHDDDDASNDDDIADDDDDTPAACDGGELPPIDLSDPAQTLDVVMSGVSMVNIAETILESYVAFGDGTCPVWDGPAMEAVDLGTATITGDGCEAITEYRYDGAATISWERSAAGTSITLDGTEFGMTWLGGTPGRGGSPAFDVLGLDGVMTWTGTDDGTTHSRSISIDGWFQAGLMDGHPYTDTFPGARVWPEGFDGTWVQEAIEAPNAETHNLDANVWVRCRGSLAHEWDLIFLVGSTCSDEPDSGAATVTAEGREVVVDPALDVNCEGCLEWTLDGALQPLPLCPVE